GPAGSATGRCWTGGPVTRSRSSTGRVGPTTGGRTSRSTRRDATPTRSSRSSWPPCGTRMPYDLTALPPAGPLLCDGAMGPLLSARGVSVDACFDVLNLNNPRVIQSIHADYIAAGADCIETNTFGANRFKLAGNGPDGEVREINRRGAALARDVRESAGRDVFVLGSIGPLGKYLAPLGTVTADEARTAFQ